MKTIFVTGTAGFIASNFINYIVKKYPDYFFISIDKIDYCSNLKNITVLKEKNHRFFKGNILNNELMDTIFDEYDINIIIHFAAQSHVDNSFENAFIFIEDNVKATVNLLEYAKKCKNLQKFIHVSTDEVYGEININDEHCTINTRLNPTNPYSASKASAEYFVLSYQKSFNIPVIISRGNNVYGPRQFPDKLIPKTIKKLFDNERMTIHGTGKNYRSFLYVDDVCTAFETIMEKGVVGKIYNIGTEYEVCNFDVIKKIIEIMKPNEDYKNWIEYVKDRPWNDLRYGVNCDDLLNLGWKEEYTFDEGLRKTIEWYKNIFVK